MKMLQRKHRLMNKTVKKTVRFTEDEYKFLKKDMESSANVPSEKYTDFSDYVRDKLFFSNVDYNRKLRHMQSDLLFEIHKIGVNINQVAKRINSGMGTHADVVYLQNELDNVEAKINLYIQKVDQKWQSPS